MPGNKLGTKPTISWNKDHLSQGKHHLQLLDGNWPVPSNSLWVVSQGQNGLLSSNSKNCIVQQTDTDRALRALHVSAHSSLRPDLAKSLSQNQQLNLNGCIFGHEVFQSKQDEANILEMDTEFDQHNLTSRGLLVFGSPQVSGPENHTKTLVRSETPESTVSFDFFGAQHQMRDQQPQLLQSRQHQPSGYSDMQQLQQQVILRKMQEHQRQQQQLQQLDARQQNSFNQLSSFGKHGTRKQPHALIIGTPISEATNYSWPADIPVGDQSWMQCFSAAMQGSSNGFLFSPDQVQHMASLLPQQADQSLYGVPVTGSRGSLNQYSHMAVDKFSIQQIPNCSNSLPGNQNTVVPNETRLQDGTLISRQGFQGKNMFGHCTVLGLNGGINMENLNPVNSPQRTSPLWEFHGRQETSPSERLQDKSVAHVTSPQDAVALDPTEEKILFGSDDNICDAFGMSSSMSAAGAGNVLDDSGFFNGLPSFQSGSWSALMQSAVAETSSSDAGIQEEWSGLSFHNAQLPAGNHQPSTINDGRRQLPMSTDDNLQGASILNSRLPFADDGNANSNIQSVSGFQPFGTRNLYSNGENQEKNSSQRPSHQSLEGGSKWLNQGSLQKPLADRKQLYGNISHSLGPQMNVRNISGSWTPQESGSCQPDDKPNGWSAAESISHAGDSVLKVSENQKSLLYSQSADEKKDVQKEMSPGVGLWKSNSDSNSNALLELVKPNGGSSLANKDGSGLNNAATVQTFSTSGASHQLNNWRSVDSSLKSKTHERLGHLQHHLSICHESSKRDAKMQDMDNKIPTSGDNHCPSGGLRDNVLSDASDSDTLLGGKQKSYNHVGRKLLCHKFQYHPMGDLDEDLEPKSHDQGYIGQSKCINNAPRSTAVAGKGCLADFQGDTKGIHKLPSRGNGSGYASNMSPSLDKPVGLYFPNKNSQSSQTMLELLQKVDQSRERETDMQNSSSDCNPSSEMPETENSDGSVGHFQGNLLLASQGFGLQLALPSQRMPYPNQAASSHSSLPAASFSIINGNLETRDSDIQHEIYQGELENNSIPGLSSGEAVHYNGPGNFSSHFNSGQPYSGSQFRGSQLTASSRQVTTNQSINMSYDRLASISKQTDDSFSKALSCQSAEDSVPDAGGSIPHYNLVLFGDAPQVANSNVAAGETASASRSLTTSGISQLAAFPKRLPNVWTDTSAHQHMLGTQSFHIPSRFSQSRQTNTGGSSCSTYQRSSDLDAKEEGNVPSDLSACFMDSQLTRGEELMAKQNSYQLVSSESPDVALKMNASQGKGSIIKNLLDGSPLNTAATRGDIEVFSCTVKPNSFSHQNYSLLNQMPSMKNAETDSSNRGVKRERGPESALSNPQVASTAGQSNEQNATGGDAVVHPLDAASEDTEKLSFSVPADNLDSNASFQSGNVPSQDLVAFSQSYSQTHPDGNTTSFRVEPYQTSPHMATSWFNQFGTFRSGQFLTLYGARKASAVTTVENLTLGKASTSLYALNSMEPAAAAGDSNQIVNIKQSSNPVSVGIEYFPSPQSIPQDITDDGSVVLRPKKLKISTSDIMPWYKEVSQGSQRCLSISMTEADWGKETNRLTDRVENEVEMIEEIPRLLRTRRRLILTTQLIQQLIWPPPASILSADASTNYERVVYAVARLALRDACGLISDNANFLPDGKASKKIDNQSLLKILEDFIGRAKNLENNFTSLEKRASIVDLRVEYQDMEKVSVINRFAKFHGRGQADGAQTLSSLDAAPNPLKPFPQIYVTALPMPRNLPDRVQCLSL